MKIRIKTSLIDLQVEDEPTIGFDNYTKRIVDSTQACLKSAIDEVIRLHNEIKTNTDEHNTIKSA